MKTRILLSLVILVLFASMIVTACSKSTPTTNVTTTTAKPTTTAATTTSPSTTTATTAITTPPALTDKPMTLRLATYAPSGTGIVPDSINYFVNEVQKRTNGLVTVQVFWSGSLATQNELFNAVQGGTADLCFSNYAWAIQAFPFATAGYGYFVLAGNSYEQGTTIWNTLAKDFPEWTQQYTKANQMSLGGFSGGAKKTIVSKKPLATLADFQGKKIAGTGTLLPPLLKEAGATPVGMGTADAYDGLDKGVIDGTVGTTDTIVRYKQYEVAKYVTTFFEGSSGQSYALHMNLDSWKKMSPALQKIIQQVGVDFTAFGNKTTLSAEGIDMNKLTANGVTFYAIPPAEFKALALKIAKPLYESTVKNAEGQGFPNARTLFDRWSQLSGFQP